MRIIATFLLLIVHLTTSYAQQEFAPVGAIWTTRARLTGIDITYPGFIECTGEEMVNGVLCKKIEGDMILASTIFVYQEDSKIYKFSTYDSLFHLLYDFAAETGESWVVEGLDDGPHTVTVDSVSWEINNGDSLKILHTNFESGNFEWGNRKIVGIGNMGWFLPKYSLADYQFFYDGVVCYEDPFRSYSFVDVPCDSIFVSNNNIVTKEILVYPNPVSSSLFIMELDDIKKVQLISLDGQILKEIDPSAHTIEVDVSHISSSIFFVKLVDSLGKLYLEKVVKCQ